MHHRDVPRIASWDIRVECADVPRMHRRQIRGQFLCNDGAGPRMTREDIRVAFDGL